MSRWLAVALLLRALPAAAHLGQVVAKADFLHPRPPEQRPGADGGLVWAYTPEEADASYRIDWVDGDLDPTGRFTFYWLDHGISDGVSFDQLRSVGTLVRDVGGREAAEVWVSCACDADLGVGCDGGGARWCDNFIEWDTSGLPDGAYWIAAANDDPPYKVYNLSFAPVRVRHGASRPPVVLVVKPDGLRSADRGYRIEVVPIGTGAMTMDLAYGDNDFLKVLGPVTTIAKNVPVVVGPDGVAGYDWDVSALPNRSYFVRAALRDTVGVVYSDSRYALPVFHAAQVDAAEPPPDLAAPRDGGVIKPTPRGCGCAVGGAGGGGLAGLLAGLLAALPVTRRGPRRGSRTSCID